MKGINDDDIIVSLNRFQSGKSIYFIVEIEHKSEEIADDEYEKISTMEGFRMELVDSKFKLELKHKNGIVIMKAP